MFRWFIFYSSDKGWFILQYIAIKLWKLNTIQLWTTSVTGQEKKGMTIHGSHSFIVCKNLEVWISLKCWSVKQPKEAKSLSFPSPYLGKNHDAKATSWVQKLCFVLTKQTVPPFSLLNLLNINLMKNPDEWEVQYTAKFHFSAIVTHSNNFVTHNAILASILLSDWMSPRLFHYMYVQQYYTTSLFTFNSTWLK